MTSDEYVTARELDVSLKASAAKIKKIYLCGEYPRPLIPLSGSTFSTGKHGKGKTRLTCLDHFTNQKVSLLVQSSLPFYEASTSPEFKESTVVVTKIVQDSPVVEVLTDSYETLSVEVDLQTLAKLQEDSSYKLQSFLDPSSGRNLLKLVLG